MLVIKLIGSLLVMQLKILEVSVGNLVLKSVQSYLGTFTSSISLKNTPVICLMNLLISTRPHSSIKVTYLILAACAKIFYKGDSSNH